MKQNNILQVLEQQLADRIPQDLFTIAWHKRLHSIEVIFRVFAENPNHATIFDAVDTASNLEFIEFEDSIILYEQTKPAPAKSEYLAAFPFDRKKGVEEAFLLALSTYLSELLENGISALTDFLADEQQEVFQLEWDEKRMNTLIQEKSQNAATTSKYIPYPTY